MRYDVIVALVFATERTDENRYDVWEIQTPVEADSPQTALLDAVVLSKRFEDWKVLGYSHEPVLYAVRSVQRESRLDVVSQKAHDQSRLSILVGSINEQQVQLLRSFKEIYLPYSFIHTG
jgi:hypothetical protein